MKKITFDEKGNLQPYKVVDIDLNSFKETFITDFKQSKTRKVIFHGYLNYIKNFLEIINADWHQFINGSFTTGKLDPNDVDIVNFVKEELIINKVTEIKKFLTLYNSKNKYKVDGYIVPLVDKKDKEKYKLIQEHIDYWIKWFGHDRQNNPKGILKLNIDSGILSIIEGIKDA